MWGTRDEGRTGRQEINGIPSVDGTDMKENQSWRHLEKRPADGMKGRV
jgi:hypothetical protein